MAEIDILALDPPLDQPGRLVPPVPPAPIVLPSFVGLTPASEHATEHTETIGLTEHALTYYTPVDDLVMAMHIKEGSNDGGKTWRMIQECYGPVHSQVGSFTTSYSQMQPDGTSIRVPMPYALVRVRIVPDAPVVIAGAKLD